MVLRYLLSIHSSSNPNADILVTSLVLKHCAHALRQPRGCYFNWLWPFVMLRATPQLYAHPRPCSGSASSMGRPRWLSPGHNRTHIGVCSLDTNRREVLARILLDGSATLDAALAAIGHGPAIRPANLRVPALVMLVLHPCQQSASHLPCTRPPDRLLPGRPRDSFRGARRGSHYRAFVSTRSGLATMPTGEHEDDTAPAAVTSAAAGPVRRFTPIAQPHDMWPSAI